MLTEDTWLSVLYAITLTLALRAPSKARDGDGQGSPILVEICPEYSAFAHHVAQWNQWTSMKTMELDLENRWTSMNINENHGFKPKKTRDVVVQELGFQFTGSMEKTHFWRESGHKSCPDLLCFLYILVDNYFGDCIDSNKSCFLVICHNQIPGNPWGFHSARAQW